VKHFLFSRAPILSIVLVVLIPLFAYESATIEGFRDSGTADTPMQFGPVPLRTNQAVDRQIIIELSEPSVVEAIIAEEDPPQNSSTSPRVSGARVSLNSPRAAVHLLRIQRLQQEFIRRLSALGDVWIQGSTAAVLNAVVARASTRIIAAIESLPEVKKVSFSREYAPDLDTAAGVHIAQGMWSAAGGSARAGAGVRIGIIDSGIDIKNLMFLDDTLVPPQGFPKGEAAFTNKKVIVARNYVSLLSHLQSIKTAVDESGHGSFVASCAAGKAVYAPLAQIGGMAQGAFLGSYKVVGTPGINDTASSAAILAAIDDAVRDGMNVLNLSLGALTYTSAAEDPVAKAVSNATVAGVVVVVSGGNLGPGSSTVSSPGDSPDAITVGAVSNARAFLPALRPTGPAVVPPKLMNVAYVPGSGIRIPARITSTLTVDISLLDGNGRACSPLPANSLKGKLAFIAGGMCSFTAKVAHVTVAGANAAIIYNELKGQDAFEIQGLTGSTIPVVMVSNGDGLELKSYLLANPSSATVEIDDTNTLARKVTTPRMLANFSSRGPTLEFSLKPDLVAVGASVYAAAQRDNPKGILYGEEGFANGNGTSAASAMVSGAAAVLKQLNPGFTPQDVKSALVNTAAGGLSIDGIRSPSLIEAGGGLLGMTRAAAAGAAFSPSSLGFGVSVYSEGLSLTRTFTIKNVSSASDQLSIAVEPLISGPIVSLSRDNTGTLAPGATSSVDVNLCFSSPVTGAFQGYVSVRSAKTSFVYRIPYWSGVYSPDSSRVLGVSQKPGADAATYASLEDALAAARPGNTVEILDSATYSAGLTLRTNQEGLPLHGITIRAAAGQKPILTGAGLSTTAAIHVVGLRNVLLQGLTIKGGLIGVQLNPTSTDLPPSVTIDHCTIADITESGGGFGILAPYGGTVTVVQSTISRCSGSGILVYGGTRLTVNRSSFHSNAFIGIEAHHSNIQILNSTFTNNAAPGAVLDSCSGTIDGSRFSGNTGTYGDGIEILGGTLDVSNSSFETNKRHGIGWFLTDDTHEKPAGSMSKNTVISNTRVGVWVDSGQNMILNGNLVRENGVGIGLLGSTSALLVNNIVTRSWGYDYPDPLWYWPDHTKRFDPVGIITEGTSSVRIVNNTIYYNRMRCCAAKEIAVLNQNSVTVANSIVDAGYSAGSLNTSQIAGVPPENVQYSLVSDSGYIRGTNITGDPKFTDWTNGDFSLASDSPAIDAGSATVDNLPFLDYAGRFRISSSRTRTGEGKVDIGALEMNSSYPLVFPLMAEGKQSLPGEAFTTGLALMSTSGATVDLAAYDPTGTLISGKSNPALQNLKPGTQLPILAAELFGLDTATPQLGAVLAGSTQKLAGFFLLFGKDFQRFADGIDVSSATGTELVFMRHQADAGGRAAYCVFNPTTTPANVSATLYTTAGSSVGNPATGVIPPKGQFVFSFDAVTLSSGIVRVRSDRPISGMEIFGNRGELSALRAASPGSEGRLYFPHFASNQGFSTIIGIVNTGIYNVNVTLTVYAGDGSPLGSSVTRSLARNGQLLEPVSSMFGLGDGPLLTGYIVAYGDKGGLAGFTSFRYDDGYVQSGASVPATSIPRPRLLFSHVAHQVNAGSGGTYQTGIALLNPYGVSVQYTMKVYNGAGQLVAEATNSLGAGEKVSKILSHAAAGAGFFTQALALDSGHIEVSSELGLIGFELFFTEDFSQLASVPAQIGD